MPGFGLQTRTPRSAQEAREAGPSLRRSTREPSFGVGFSGNQAMLRRLSPVAQRVQFKLVVGAVDDPLEREADQAADHVMRMPDPTVALAAAPPAVSRKCAACEEDEKKLRAKSDGALAQGAEAPASVERVRSSGGRPLDPASRAFFEPRFGRSFDGVRVHDDSLAAASAREVGALAYAVGQHVVFASSAAGMASDLRLRLLAHELAHVVQQGAAGEYVRRAPCRTPAQCAGKSLCPTPPGTASAGAGDPSKFDQKVNQSQQARAAQLNAAPPGSPGAALKARQGERAVHFENVLTANGIALRPEIAGFFVDPTADPKVVGAGTSQCKNFPGGSPGKPPVPDDKFCVQLPAETEDQAARLDFIGPRTEDQAEEIQGILATGVHEMQHAKFDAVEQDPATRTIAPAADCDLDKPVPPTNYPVEYFLTEISAITSEFPVFFQNIAHTANPAKGLEREEQNQAFNGDESLCGAISALQCGCSCPTTESFVTQTVNKTTTGWPAAQLNAYLKTMTARIPGLWPQALKRS